MKCRKKCWSVKEVMDGVVNIDQIMQNLIQKGRGKKIRCIEILYGNDVNGNSDGVVGFEIW